MGSPYYKGSSQFTPWHNDENWKQVIGKEEKFLSLAKGEAGPQGIQAGAAGKNMIHTEDVVEFRGLVNELKTYAVGFEAVNGRRPKRNDFMNDWKERYDRYVKLRNRLKEAHEKRSGTPRALELTTKLSTLDRPRTNTRVRRELLDRVIHDLEYTQGGGIVGRSMTPTGRRPESVGSRRSFSVDRARSVNRLPPRPGH